MFLFPLSFSFVVDVAVSVIWQLFLLKCWGSGPWLLWSWEEGYTLGCGTCEGSHTHRAIGDRSDNAREGTQQCRVVPGLNLMSHLRSHACKAGVLPLSHSH